MVHQSPLIVFGTGGIGYAPPEAFLPTMEVLEKHGVKDLDTAFIYPQSEEILGKVGAAKRFTISTKAPGFQPGNLSKAKILEGIDKSLSDLGVSNVDIYYLHAPDPSVPIEETLEAIREVYAAGKFKRFGVSNFLPDDVQKIYDIQASHKSVLPTVFQGNYNAVSRHIESNLFPLLRKLGISFYAYSPIAGGFLVKDPVKLRANENLGARFGSEANTPVGEMYQSMYSKESIIKALEEWVEIAKSAGISQAALSYRWIAFHSALDPKLGDAVIFGASKLTQLEETLSAFEAGPLDEEIAKKADAIWKTIEHDAPLDNYNSFAAIKGSL